MSTLFIADLHLQDEQPKITAFLLDFLAGPASSSEAIYILGDLFEFWIGDDTLSRSAREVAQATSRLNETGVSCYFQHGNRDFLLGEAYASQAGLQLLPESLVLDLYGVPTLLLHGDTLCTDDVEYQAFRHQTRNPAWQAGFLALPLEERIQMARSARDASKEHTGSASMDIMDVNDLAVREAFVENDVRRMIHGHTHRPAIKYHDLSDGDKGERYILSAWYDAGNYLEVSAQGAEFRNL